MKTFFPLTFLLPLLFLTACPDGSDPELEIPQTAENLTIEINDGGGMLPIWYEIYISKDSAYWSYFRYEYETNIRWIPTQKEIDQLYEVLKKNEFNKIRSDCENQVYDRGGRSLHISVGNNNYSIDNSGNCFISEQWLDHYTNINQAINEYYSGKIDEQLVTIPVQVSKGLIDLGYSIKIRINEKGDFFNATADTMQQEFTLYPGYNKFIVQLFYKDSISDNGQLIQYMYEQYFKEVSDSTSKILIDWKDDNLNVTPVKD